MQIIARDRYGNRRRTGQDMFTIPIQGKNGNIFETMGVVTDNNDGSYDVSYLAVVTGEYDVNIMEGPLQQNHLGRPVGAEFSFEETDYLPEQSPFLAIVTPSEVTLPNLCNRTCVLFCVSENIEHIE